MKRVFLAIILFGLYNINYSQSSCPGTQTVTYGNKIYHTVQIGDQCWLKENLDIGTMINSLKDATNNGVVEKYCYEDDPSNCEKYGALYSWSEAMKYSPSGTKAQGICPSGWRLPTFDEFTALAAAVKDDGNALKDETPVQGHVLGSNTSGFSALLAGTRGYGGHFSHIEVHAFFWSSTPFDNSYVYKLSLDYINNYIDLLPLGSLASFSVRCIKGEGTTDVSEAHERNDVSTQFAISQNYPNPFNPSTKIQYSLTRPGKILIRVFDITGREIDAIVNEYKLPGIYTVDFNGSKLSSGTYYYQLQADDFVQTRKFIVIK